MKNLLTFIVLIVFSLGALMGALNAQTVGITEAETYAENVLYYYYGESVDFQMENAVTRSSGEVPLYYTFRDENHFVIISAERSFEPVLGYSNTSGLPENAEDLPPAFIEWMDDLAEQISYVRDHDIEVSERAVSNWEKITVRERASGQTRGVAPLLSTTWNQGCGYNGMCPVDASGPCNHVYTGCVATAQAQVMKYHAHPASGVGSECYTHSDYGELCADYAAATYDWASMPDNSGNPDVEELMYHCGVSVSMNYSPTGSGAYTWSVDNALMDHFDYTDNMEYLSRYSFESSDWEALMRKECDAGRVMVYKGTGSGGHAFVLDGYNDSNEFHFNWGWGGTADGYYTMGNLNPAGHDYSNSNSAIIGVEPAGNFTGLDFSGMTSLSCGSTTPVDMSSGQSYVNNYGNSWLDAYGKERVFEFTTSFPGRITIDIENPTKEISVVLLSHQHKDSVLSYGTNGLIYDNSLLGTYYLVLDVAEAQTATCDLQLICPTADADLIAEYAQIVPGVIETGQSGVILKSDVTNIGNSAAASCDMEYYLSDNDTLDGGDLLIGSATIPALDVGNTANLESTHTMPVLPVPGFYYVLAVSDAGDVVPETVDDDFTYTNVQIPDTGYLDCSSATAVSDGVWYYDNTAVNGDSVINQYGCGWDMTGNEMVYSLTSPYDGIADVYFTEKNFGTMSLMVQPVCNEHANCLTSVSIWNTTDTLAESQFQMIGGVEYFLVVDGENDLSGEFGFKINFPAVCPDDTLQYWGDTARCDGDGGLNMQVMWGYDSYQWYRDGLAIPEATNMSYFAETTGEYYAEITENGCTIESDHLNLAYSPAPDTAAIDTFSNTLFCEGDSVDIHLTEGNAWDVLWYKDGEPIPGATADIYTATETGYYHADVINVSCHLQSNEIYVHVNEQPADLGETISVANDNLIYYFPLDDDAQDASGNGHGIDSWPWYPMDDHDGNFWQARQFIDTATSSYVFTQFDNPTVFTHSMWFISNDGNGGSLILFTDDSWSPGGTLDRSLYMADDGKLHFFLNNSGSPVEITSSDAYNDGNWHHVVIKADTYAEMIIDQTEYLNDVTVLNLDDFAGYWLYGGHDIPSGATNPPADAYFQGGIDDLYYFHRAIGDQEIPHIVEDHSLQASLANDTICGSGNVYIDIQHSEPGIYYIIREVGTSDTLSVTGMGTGGALSIGGDLYLASTDFEILATDTASGCNKILSDVFHLEVLPIQTPDVTISSGSGTDVCAGDTVNLTSSTYAAGSSPTFSWLLNGTPTGDTGDTLSISTLNDGDSLQLVMISTYACASVMVDTSDAIHFNVQDYPVVSFTYDTTYCANEDVSVIYTGDEIGVSIAWELNGISQTETGGGTHDFDYSTPGMLNITAIGITSFGCETTTTETTQVNANPVASFTMPGDLCENQEFQVEYTGTETNIDTITWATSPGPAQDTLGPGIHTFTAYGSGSFDVSLFVEDNHGCTATAISTSPVHAQPDVDFTLPPDGCVDQQITAEYTGTTFHNTVVSWDVDGVDQGIPAPGTGTQHLYTSSTGLVDVTASAVTDYGCVDDTTLSLTVYESPVTPLADTTWICPNTHTPLDAGNPGSDYTWTSSETTQVIDLYNNPGFLSVIIDNGHCSITDSTEVAMYPMDMYEFPEGTDTTVCVGEYLDMSIPAPYNNNVEWHIGTDTLYGNALHYPYPGVDSIMVEMISENDNGCWGLDTLIVNYEDCTGIEDVSGELSLHVYPNPARAMLFVECAGGEYVNMYDITGRLLFAEKISSGKTSIDLKAVSEGMYFIEVSRGDNRIMRKVEVVK
ncbi:MAG: C10 family peptidase [Bacteroidota bacterium]|nr:C10 family peptidase [Bacteroidota bacterium]